MITKMPLERSEVFGGTVTVGERGHVVIPAPVSKRQSVARANSSGDYQPWVLKAEAANRDAALGTAREAAVHLRVSQKTDCFSTARGDGADAILRSACRDGADVVIIGSAPRRGWETLMGNTARCLLIRQTLATLVVHSRP